MTLAELIEAKKHFDSINISKDERVLLPDPQTYCYDKYVIRKDKPIIVNAAAFPPVDFPIDIVYRKEFADGMLIWVLDK
jgi:hypothetical protein